MSAREHVERISLSLPGNILREFDEIVEERGFDSRSQAVSELVAREIDRYSTAESDGVMAGTITLVYEHSKGDLKKRLSDIQYANINEVISTMQVLLENHHTLEVILVQGKANVLRKIADALITSKGVKSGGISLTAPVMPPIQYPD